MGHVLGGGLWRGGVGHTDMGYVMWEWVGYLGVSESSRGGVGSWRGVVGDAWMGCVIWVSRSWRGRVGCLMYRWMGHGGVG